MSSAVAFFGTLAGGAAPYAGTKAGQLDGVDEYLLGSSFVAPSAGFSITGWIYMSGGTGVTLYHQRQSSSQGVQIRVTSGGNLRVTWENSGTEADAAGGTLTANQWRHFGATFENVSGTATVKAYVSGVEVATGSDVPSSVNTTTAAPYVGKLANASAGYVNGRVCDLAFWDGVVLDGDDMLALYNAAARKDPRTCGVGTPSRLWAFTEGDDMTGTTGSIEDLMGGAVLTPQNTESGDLVAGP